MSLRPEELANALSNQDNWNITFISGAATTAVKAAPGVLGFITWKTSGSSLVQIYNHPSTATNQVGEFDPASVSGTVFFMAPMSNGITIVTTGAGVRLSVMWK